MKKPQEVAKEELSKNESNNKTINEKGILCCHQ